MVQKYNARDMGNPYESRLSEKRRNSHYPLHAVWLVYSALIGLLQQVYAVLHVVWASTMTFLGKVLCHCPDDSTNPHNLSSASRLIAKKSFPTLWKPASNLQPSTNARVDDFSETVRNTANERHGQAIRSPYEARQIGMYSAMSPRLVYYSSSISRKPNEATRANLREPYNSVGYTTQNPLNGNLPTLSPSVRAVERDFGVSDDTEDDNTVLSLLSGHQTRGQEGCHNAQQNSPSTPEKCFTCKLATRLLKPLRKSPQLLFGKKFPVPGAKVNAEKQLNTSALEQEVLAAHFMVPYSSSNVKFSGRVQQRQGELAVDERQRYLRFRYSDVEVRVDGMVNEGGFGRVLIATVVKQPARSPLRARQVALKAYNKKQLQCSEDLLGALRMDIRMGIILGAYGAKWLLPVWGTLEDASNVYVMMELCRGTLSDHIWFRRRPGTARLPIEIIRFYSAELVLAVEEMQALHIVHRDLKPNNILIDADGHLVVADFGVSIAADRESDGHFATRIEDEIYHESVGTFGYLAPEVESSRGHNYVADMWSLGLIIFEMFWGDIYFDCDPDEGQIESKSIWTDILSSVAPDASDLVLGLLQPDPNFRYKSIPSIKANKFFRGINWAALERKAQRGPIIPAPIVPKGPWWEAIDLPDPEPLEIEELDWPCPDYTIGAPRGISNIDWSR